ncbi:SLATT domain-containing protein [Tatumella saanichensis]|uniref:SLATT domain-containing protein n=1 Tax=Tatumella saanichensis TaxID=480813 RepID=UPI0004A2AEE4|nr:SLATT domain-containing protein [Tatumella saanichensis]
MNTEHNLKSLVELETQIGRRISEFEGKRRENQRNNKFFSISQIILSAITTLLVAINADVHMLFVAILTLIVSMCSGIAGQLLNKFMYQERMAMNIATICSLYELQQVITMAKRIEEDDANSKITIRDVVKYQGQYQNILNAANGHWQNNIQNSKSSEK